MSPYAVWRACGRKRAYRKRCSAIRAQHELETQRGERGLHVYVCEVCGSFHVGHRGWQAA